MPLRIARKIAKRVHASGPRRCPYNEEQLFRAFMRLHRAWLARTTVTLAEAHDHYFNDGKQHFFLSITPDYQRGVYVSDVLIRVRHFPRVRGHERSYRYLEQSKWPDKYHDHIHNCIRTTWVTKARKRALAEARRA